ncbi:uncharacterized protein Z519_08634 [Cladophialophora bantiana CBS 173.52]|uniref:DUF7580 domain-containing protein n=1 Tax=Cladophialophora bantiana (strain ATCC 10958 / CBS 173.52 / CDC B-1940 / NIH 8579) TaxID=1442370 RepID=A0A0D2ELG6_CLAB1|nr:uncharacterized protein Z519_08634 [Cladophialophora bantiana CBS 173.52]KIW90851.1 hypothetical protein Z519_08634 [Cladophialophora bantiana CBS 173.52]
MRHDCKDDQSFRTVEAAQEEDTIRPFGPSSHWQRMCQDEEASRPLLHDLCLETRLAQQGKARLHPVVDEKGQMITTGQSDTVADKDRMLFAMRDYVEFKLYDHKRWLQREKTILAVILAYSLLQLHESSWWQSLWNPQSPALRRNAHLHALGVVLLELYLNRSTKEVVDAPGGIDYRGVAQDLLEEHSDDINMTTEYIRAVRFCLSPHPNPYSGSFSFEDEGFREIFYSEVISMLEDNLVSRFEADNSIWRDERIE